MFSKPSGEHTGHLAEGLSLLEDGGASLLVSRCLLLKEEVNYPLHLMRTARVFVNKKGTKAPRGLSYTRTLTTLTSFLRMSRVYRTIVYDITKVAWPL